MPFTLNNFFIRRGLLLPSEKHFKIKYGQACAKFYDDYMVAGGFSNSQLPTVYHHLCGLCLARKRALASGFHLMAQLLIEPLASSLGKKLLRPLCWFRKSLRIIRSSELLFRNRATPELACRKGIFFLAFF